MVIAALVAAAAVVGDIRLPTQSECDDFLNNLASPLSDAVQTCLTETEYAIDTGFTDSWHVDYCSENATAPCAPVYRNLTRVALDYSSEISYEQCRKVGGFSALHDTVCTRKPNGDLCSFTTFEDLENDLPSKKVFALEPQTQATMANMCTECAKLREMAFSKAMILLNPPDRDENEFYARLYTMTCMKVEGEGYCAPSFAIVVQDLLYGTMAKPNETLYCSRTTRCGRKIINAYISVTTNHLPESMTPIVPMEASVMAAILKFTCNVNPRGVGPEDDVYCLDLINGGSFPWSTPACQASYEAQALRVLNCNHPANCAGSGPGGVETAPAQVEPACSVDMAAEASKYGCCISEIAEIYQTLDPWKNFPELGAMKKNYVLDFFANSNVALQPLCDLYAEKATVQLLYDGVSTDFLETNMISLKNDIAAAAGILEDNIVNIAITAKAEPGRRRLSNGATTGASVSVQLGAQTPERAAASAMALTTDFDSPSIKTDAAVKSMEMGSVSSEVQAPSSAPSASPTILSPTIPPTASPEKEDDDDDSSRLVVVIVASSLAAAGCLIGVLVVIAITTLLIVVCVCAKKGRSNKQAQVSPLQELPVLESDIAVDGTGNEQRTRASE